MMIDLVEGVRRQTTDQLCAHAAQIVQGALEGAVDRRQITARKAHDAQPLALQRARGQRATEHVILR